MKFSIDTTLERDIDLLILEEFVVSHDFAKLFLSAVGITEPYEILNAIHSKRDAAHGESDIVFIIKTGCCTRALHIENKIDASAMPQQRARYDKRAQKDIENGEYDSFSVMIVAPELYLKKNSEAKKYPCHVTYEQMEAYFSESEDIRSRYKLALIQRAIHDQKVGYQWEENPDVARFCNAMYEYQRDLFPRMPIGSVAWWPEWKTVHTGVKVVYKANKGHCDLSLRRTPSELLDISRAYLKPYMTIAKTGKSSSIRICVRPVWFENDFEPNKKDVKEALQAVFELLELAKELKV